MAEQEALDCLYQIKEESRKYADIVWVIGDNADKVISYILESNKFPLLGIQKKAESGFLHPE